MLGAGDRLGAYAIESAIGSGGMGEVYRARDTKLDRVVALKVLSSTLAADPQFRKRFEREAKAAAALNHPNIVTLYSVEEAAGALFITMELVEGGTLADQIPKGGLSIDRLLAIAIPLADAVSAAHERGITHRDLKPANVMLAHDGRVKVLDFGLAKLREAAAPSDRVTMLPTQELTGEGRILGTVAYMSPEQAEGKAVDHRSDVFSLGVLLYEMATGERPFKGDTSVSVISAIIKDTPPSVTDVNVALPRDLARIVKRALVKDPEHRYQTAKDLRNDLETLKEELNAGVAASAAAGARAQAATASRTWKIVAAAAVAIGVLLAAGSWYTHREGSRPAPVAAFTNIKLARLTNTGSARLAAISPDGRYVVHVVDEGKGQSLWMRQTATTSNVQIVPLASARYDGLAFAPDGNYVYYNAYVGAGSIASLFQIPVLGGVPRKILEDIDSPVTFSPDGRQVAFLRGYQTLGEAAVIVANTDGSGERKLAVRKQPFVFPLNNLAWSSDGRTIAVPALVPNTQPRQMNVVAIDVASGKETPIGNRLWSSIDTVAWLGGGAALAVIGSDVSSAAGPPTSRPFENRQQQVWYVSYPGGDARRITNDLNQYRQIGASADATQLVAVQDDALANLWVVPADDPSRAVRITSGTGRMDGFEGVGWTPDGRIVYGSYASGNADIWICDADGSNQRQLTVHPAVDAFPVVTRDGRYVVFFSDRAGGNIWRMDLDGGNQRQLTREPSTLPIPSPDGKWVYYTSLVSTQRTTWKVPIEGGDPVQLVAKWEGARDWEGLGGQPEGTFYHPTLTVRAVSPDGALVAGFYTDAAERGWRIGIFPVGGGSPTHLPISLPIVQWAPDGRSLAYLDPFKNWNVFTIPHTGGTPKAVTTFTDDLSFSFAWSHDGKRLVVSRGTVRSDVVLITDVGAR